MTETRETRKTCWLSLKECQKRERDQPHKDFILSCQTDESYVELQIEALSGKDWRNDNLSVATAILTLVARSRSTESRESHLQEAERQGSCDRTHVNWSHVAAREV